MTKRAAAIIVWIAVLSLGCHISDIFVTVSPPPFKVSPERLAVPGGSVARFDVYKTDTLLSDPFEWDISGLPPGASAEFSTGIGYPVDGVLLIHTAGTSPVGEYPLEVVLSTDERTWTQAITLEMSPCEDVIPTGSFTTHTRIAHLAGGPSTLTYGSGSPVLVFCESATPRRLTVYIESVIGDEAGSESGSDVVPTLYRLLDWPPPDAITEIVTENRDDLTAEAVLTGENGTLAWDVAPGAFFVYFPAVSVTYRLDVEPLP